MTPPPPPPPPASYASNGGYSCSVAAAEPLIWQSAANYSIPFNIHASSPGSNFPILNSHLSPPIYDAAQQLAMPISDYNLSDPQVGGSNPFEFGYVYPSCADGDLMDLVLPDQGTAAVGVAEAIPPPLPAADKLPAAGGGAALGNAAGHELQSEHDFVEDGPPSGVARRSSSLQLSKYYPSPPAHMVLPPPPPPSDIVAAAAAAASTGDSDIHICRDSSREFGLNPILGCPLTAAAKAQPEFNEICVLHLLMAATEAVAAKEVSLASVILARLREFVVSGRTAVQRVAAYFSQGLEEACAAAGGGGVGVGGGAIHAAKADVLAAFRFLQQASPYIQFGHFTANQAILEATRDALSIHIVDMDIMEGIQWPPLMQALASRRRRRRRHRRGRPPRLRITALYSPNYAVATAYETGKRLADFASLLNIPFSLTWIPVGGGGGGDGDEELSAAADIDIRPGEVVVVNCMLHLLHMPYKSATAVGGFLRAARQLSPRLLTIVEEELCPAAGSSSSSSAAFFADAIRHYSAICDSLDSISCLQSGGAHEQALA